MCLDGGYPSLSRGLLGGSGVENLPAVWDTRVQLLGPEDSLEREMATHSSVGNPMDREAWRAASHGVAKSHTQLTQQQQQQQQQQQLPFPAASPAARGWGMRSAAGV